VWYVAYGHDDAVAAPEIYYKSMANQWASISWYSKNYHSSEMAYIAPWDEYGLDHSTDTPTQAWNNLWDSSAALGVATTPPYSMEVSYE
jgi:hypothetical protein